ncbi:MAG: hypothetical protein ACOYN4_00465 [Bacteroidales bacterium]
MSNLSKTTAVINEILNGQFRTTSAQEIAVTGSELIDGTGWTLGAGWAGDTVSGFVHTTGNTASLTRAMTATGTKVYHITFTVTSPTQSFAITVKIGNSTTWNIYKSSASPKTYTLGIQSVSNGPLEFIPATGFDGTITSISVKEVTGGSVQPISITDSTNNNSVELRGGPSSFLSVYMGRYAGRDNVSGDNNVGVGYSALGASISGFWNVAVGFSALGSNRSGSRNVAIGNRALEAGICTIANIAIGSMALIKHKSGDDNIGLGADSLFNSLTGYGNLAVGASAFLALSTGHDNVSMGNTSSQNNNGNFNVSVGNAAFFSNTSGSNNVSIGYQAARGGSNGSFNYCVCIGMTAGVALTSGSQNILIGRGAGSTLTDGYNNIMIGYLVAAPTAGTGNFLNIGATIYGDISTKKIGVGIIVPTAYLHLPASTAAADTASLKINPGVIATTPVSGNIESDGTHLYWTDSAGSRKQLDN